MPEFIRAFPIFLFIYRTVKCYNESRYILNVQVQFCEEGVQC